MEASYFNSFFSYYEVLILIIMEDTHGELRTLLKVHKRKVLILIIMEDTHGVHKRKLLHQKLLLS